MTAAVMSLLMYVMIRADIEQLQSSEAAILTDLKQKL